MFEVSKRLDGLYGRGGYAEFRNAEADQMKKPVQRGTSTSNICVYAQDAEDMRARRMDKAQQPRCIMWARTTLLLSLLRTEYRHLHHHAAQRSATQRSRSTGFAGC